MAVSVKDLIDEIIAREGNGKFTNDADDAGGATRWGITQGKLAEYLHHPVTCSDVQNLSRELAEEIYKDDFYVGPKINQLVESVQPAVMDAGVMSGPRTAIKMLQDVISLAGFPCSSDGVIGPKTRDLVAKASGEMGGYLVNAYAERRIHFYEHLAETNPADKKWLHGWVNRANKFRVEIDGAT